MRESDFYLIKNIRKGLNLMAVYNAIIREDERDIIDLQQEQLNAGLADRGDPLQPGYAPYTIQEKKKKGQPTDRVTLKDKGDFYRGQYVKFHRENFEITSRNRRRNKLVRKYEGSRGGDVFGLTDESRAIFAAGILPKIQKSAKEKLLELIKR